MKILLQPVVFRRVKKRLKGETYIKCDFIRKFIPFFRKNAVLIISKKSYSWKEILIFFFIWFKSWFPRLDNNHLMQDFWLFLNQTKYYLLMNIHLIVLLFHVLSQFFHYQIDKTIFSKIKNQTKFQKFGIYLFAASFIGATIQTMAKSWHTQKSSPRSYAFEISAFSKNFLLILP